MKRLLSVAKKNRVSLFVLLLTAYLETIRIQGERKNKIIINIPTSGRVYPHVDATQVLGDFAQNMALDFKLRNQSEDLESMMTRIQDEMNAKLSSGIDRAQCYQAATMVKEQISLENGKMFTHYS